MTPITSEPKNAARLWRVADDQVLHLDQPRLLGVLNATPDSFSDGGMYPSIDALVGAALRFVEEGAEIIDVGGESTRPGSMRVGEAEQIQRTIPAIEELRRCSDALISIDTTRSAVAQAALEAGANIINDQSAGLEDEGMLPLAAQRGCGLILMHRKAAPPDDSYSHQYEREPEYGDVVQAVRRFLRDRCAAAEAAGVAHEAIVIDPGLGFGKSVDQNYQLIARSAELVAEGYPVLGAASRKSFIGAVTGIETPRDRVIGSAAASTIQYLAGVRLFRVHDVAAHREALAVTWAVERASKGMPAAPAPVG
jgi:dihydropteroate synthase